MGTAEPLVTVNDKNIILWCPGCEELHAVTRTSSRFNGDVARPHCGFTSLYGKKPRSVWDKQRCHFFIVRGCLEFVRDSTHKLTGQIVSMVPVSEWTHKIKETLKNKNTKRSEKKKS